MRAEKRLPSNGLKCKSGIVVGDFAKSAERIFRHDSRDLRFDRGGLKGNGRAHRFTEIEQVPHDVAGEQRVDDGL